jgi:hypothetical protein
MPVGLKDCLCGLLFWKKGFCCTLRFDADLLWMWSSCAFLAGLKRKLFLSQGCIDEGSFSCLTIIINGLIVIYIFLKV